MWRKNKFTSSELIVVICVVAILASALILGFNKIHKTRDAANLTKCKGSLKNINLVLQSYYSDGTVSDFGVAAGNNNITEKVGEFGFDINMLSCYGGRSSGNETAYVFDKNSGNLNTFIMPLGKEKPFTKADTWAVVNNSNSALIHDKSTGHKYNNKVNVGCGDGHVEEK